MLIEQDLDLNIFMREIENPRTGEFYYDPTSWMVHVYECSSGNHVEAGEAHALTAEEIRSLALNDDEYFEGGDAWYGMDAFLNDYADLIPDSLSKYLNSFYKPLLSS
jgi:hypothetical protein